MKKIASALIAVALTCAPVFAAGPQAAVVLYYRDAAGVEGPVVYTQLPVGDFDMGDCRVNYSSWVSHFKMQNRVNPKYAAMTYVGGKCELYTDELLTRAGQFHG